MRAFHAGDGLDGPVGILQGGFASTVAVAAARLADDFGAPLTSVSSRLHAPTPLRRDLQVALRPGDGAARYEVEVRDGDRRLVTSTVELAGHEPSPHVGDLVELARLPLPDLRQQHHIPSCWMCGTGATHPLAQRMAFGFHGEGLVAPWMATDQLATTGPDGGPSGAVDPLVVGAVLDCPGAWTAIFPLMEDDWAGVLLGGYELRVFRPVPIDEPLRLVGRLDRAEGRKVSVRAAVVDDEGVVHALASALHVAVREMPVLG